MNPMELHRVFPKCTFHLFLSLFTVCSFNLSCCVYSRIFTFTSTGCRRDTYAGCSNQMQLAEGHHLNTDLALVLPALGCCLLLRLVPFFNLLHWWCFRVTTNAFAHECKDRGMFCNLHCVVVCVFVATKWLVSICMYHVL